jgi:outer membrane protein OmpA-like peptidoglycan-associated protein
MQNRCGWVAAAFAGVALVQLASVAQAGDVLVLPTREPAAPVVLAAADFQKTAGDCVFFAEGSAKLGASARAALQTQAQWLLRNSAVLVTLLGHADNHGDDDFVLSEHGAEAMRQRLPPQITVLVFGRSQSFANGADAVCAEQARGVSLIALPQPATAADYELALRHEHAPRRPPRWQF